MKKRCPCKLPLVYRPTRRNRKDKQTVVRSNRRQRKRSLIRLHLLQTRWTPPKLPSNPPLLASKSLLLPVYWPQIHLLASPPASWNKPYTSMIIRSSASSPARQCALNQSHPTRGPSHDLNPGCVLSTGNAGIGLPEVQAHNFQ